MMRDDWVEITVGDAGEVVSGGTPKTSNPEYWGDEISWITPADLSMYTQKSISKGRKSITATGLKNSSAKMLPANSILFSSRAPVGYVVIAQNEVCTNQGFKSLIPFRFLNSEYIYYYFKSIKQKAENKASGTTFKELSAKSFSLLPLPLSPLPEQRAIVAKIEKLLSDLDNGIANFKTAKAKLEIFRQAVLKKAFEGELTKVKVTPRPISDFANLVTKGASPKWQGFNYINDDSKLLFVTSENIRDGFIDLNKRKYLPFEFNEIQKRSILKNGDVLFNLVGASIGRSAIFCFDILANINQAVSIIRLNNDLYNKYLNYFLNSEIAKQEYLRKIVDVARANLSLKDVNGILIPYCPLNEQHAIVAAIETRLSVCDKMTEIIDQSLEKAEALRQSILKKAFEGKLLSDDELAVCRREADWEPAQKLLERIREDKAGGGKKTRAGKRRTA